MKTTLKQDIEAVRRDVAEVKTSFAEHITQSVEYTTTLRLVKEGMDRIWVAALAFSGSLVLAVIAYAFLR
jgi:hypothetical protein